MCKIDLFLLIRCIRYDIIFQEELYEAVGFAKTLPFNYKHAGAHANIQF